MIYPQSLRMTNGGPPANSDPRVIDATCCIHAGERGYCALEVSTDGEDILLNPHVTGACQLLFTLAEARELHAAIGELL